mgnify:CR=1 FL=1
MALWGRLIGPLRDCYFFSADDAGVTLLDHDDGHLISFINVGGYQYGTVSMATLQCTHAQLLLQSHC